MIDSGVVSQLIPNPRDPGGAFQRSGSEPVRKMQNLSPCAFTFQDPLGWLDPADLGLTANLRAIGFECKNSPYLSSGG